MKISNFVRVFSCARCIVNIIGLKFEDKSKGDCLPDYNQDFTI